MKINLSQANIVAAIGCYLQARGLQFDTSKPLEIEFSTVRKPSFSISADVALGEVLDRQSGDVGTVGYGTLDLGETSAQPVGEEVGREKAERLKSQAGTVDDGTRVQSTENKVEEPVAVVDQAQEKTEAGKAEQAEKPATEAEVPKAEAQAKAEEAKPAADAPKAEGSLFG